METLIRCACQHQVRPTFDGALPLRCGALRVPPPRRRLDRVSRLRANMRMSVLGGFEEARKAASKINFCREDREPTADPMSFSPLARPKITSGV